VAAITTGAALAQVLARWNCSKKLDNLKIAVALFVTQYQVSRILGSNRQKPVASNEILQRESGPLNAARRSRLLMLRISNTVV
jgi:hypothetical protein